VIADRAPSELTQPNLVALDVMNDFYQPIFLTSNLSGGDSETTAEHRPESQRPGENLAQQRSFGDQTPPQRLLTNERAAVDNEAKHLLTSFDKRVRHSKVALEWLKKTAGKSSRFT